ncbi:MAG TPA: OmpW family outer membrane protein [Pseudomonadales bacterium]|nr:OmpW family outer membrane protein [Pseudomonadales bacterium]
MKKIIAGTLLALTAGATQALEAGDVLIRLGMATDIPHESTHIVGIAGTDDVSLDYTPGAVGNITYMFTSNWGLEFSQSSPFNHQIQGHGGAAVGHIGEYDAMYSTLLAQYHFNAGDFKPYVGAGINYAYFLHSDLNDSDPTLKAAGITKMKMANDLSPAVEVGVDYKLNDHAYANLSAMYTPTSTKAKLSGPGGNVDINMDIDPVVFTLAFGYKL